MHGCVDQDADLDSTPDFDSSQAGSSSQLAPNVTVGAKQFRCTEVSFQRGYQCNIKCVVLHPNGAECHVVLSRGTNVFQQINQRMAKEQTALYVVMLCHTCLLPS